MVLVHRFVEVEPGVTEVQLSADAPSTLGRKIWGRCSSSARGR